VPLSQYERSVLLFNLRLQMVPEGATPSPPVTMVTAMRSIVDAWHRKEARIRVGEYAAEEIPETEERQTEGAPAGETPERPNLLQIKEIDWDQGGIVTMSFSHGDSRAADPALLHIPDDKIWTAGKTDDDALAHAAHLMISTEQPLLTRSGHSRGLLERVPGVSRSAIMLLFDRILREDAKRTGMTFTDVDRHTKPCHPRLASLTQPSQELREDIEGGKLTGIEFITQKVGPGFDAPDVVEPQSLTLKYKIMHPPFGQAALDFIFNATKWAHSNDFDEILVHFTDGRTKKAMSSRFRTDVEDARELIYSRHKTIDNFGGRLAQHPESIVKEIYEKMAIIIKQPGLWA